MAPRNGNAPAVRSRSAPKPPHASRARGGPVERGRPNRPAPCRASEKEQRGVADQEVGVRFNRYGGKSHEEPQTIYWQPRLRTDPDGHATVRFTLPDQPGTYRVEIVGHTDGRLGFATSTLTTK